MSKNELKPSTPSNDLRSVLTGDAMKKQIALALPRQVGIDRFLRVAMTTINKTPTLLECTRDSVLAAIMDCAQLGLEPDNVMGRAYILPYKGRAQLIVGYKGYIDLFYRSGMGQGLLAEAVYEKDHFVYSLGLTPRLEHVPSDSDDRGALKYAYAVAELTGGGKVWRVLNRAQVMKAKASSQSANSNFSPWNTNPEEMWIKTAIRSLAKRLPLSPELRDAIAKDESDVHLSQAMPTIDVQAEPALSDTAQALNVAIAEATAEGVSGDEILAILAKHGGQGANVIERVRTVPADKSAECIESIKMAIRAKVEA